MFFLLMFCYCTFYSYKYAVAINHISVKTNIYIILVNRYFHGLMCARLVCEASFVRFILSLYEKLSETI